MTAIHQLLDRLEELLTEADQLEEPVRGLVFGLLDGVDSLHRLALHRLAEATGPEVLRAASEGDPAVAWLLGAYGVGIDERDAADAALDKVRPYISSHGGSVELIDVEDGRVSLRMAGSCAGCTASAATLSERIEEALRDGLPGFVAVEVEEDLAAAPHPPPRETFVELGRKSA